MHKITKGLKKKKKGKKSKKGEEELFKPEELENYRKEHQGTSEEPAAQNEEWKKFLALTSGVDDILKKTQGDLDRIKSTSFFQRKPTESEVRKVEEEKLAQEQKAEEAKRELEPPTPSQLGIVEVSESESEEDEDDNIFDTTYIEALEAADLKLAYIPESPTLPNDGDDPFDTSAAEKAILGPEFERKGKKLVPLGAAVEVLTGRVQLPTCATKRPTPNKRQILKEKDLLLQSFDESIPVSAVVTDEPQEVQKTLLDDDFIPLPEEPIDLNNPIPFPQAVATVNVADTQIKQEIDNKKDIISEFDVISKLDDEDDLEFEALAAESLSRPIVANQSFPVDTGSVVPQNIKWGAFGDEIKEEDEEVLADDPFDTTFADRVVPDFNREDVTTAVTLKTSSTNGKDFADPKSRVPESGLNLIKPEDRDLLGGSHSDLANSVSISKTAFKPVTEIKVLDNESDDEFDPRADEQPRSRTVSRPDVLNITGSKTVSFDLPSPDLNTLNTESKIIKPLTPFYTRKVSIPEVPISEDPFDTSFASNVTPGKIELRLIENELFDPNLEKKLSINDNNFNPRDEAQSKVDKVVKTIKEISKPKPPSTTESIDIDLLAIDNNIAVKVLTPGASIEQTEELSYCDPFDTSIASNILPGRVELKLLESELIPSVTSSSTVVKRDLLIHDADEVIEKPLSPSAEVSSTVVFDTFDETYDPFDTSCALDIQPGRAELKVLESEFIHNGC
ncbi:protein stoned-A [Diabrotica undecimpunctata]|uniref:protein stoned-A n=1 Tax=Diabrotica undecimpunctata TaxID=50387 RepID=UPI003B637D5B